MPVGGWSTAPAIAFEHGVSGTPYPNVYAAYEKCADFFTFGPGSTINTDDGRRGHVVLDPDGDRLRRDVHRASSAGSILEDRKLKRQAAYLISAGVAKTVHEELTGGTGT